MIVAKSTPPTIIEDADLSETVKVQAQRQRFRKNAAWLQAHAPQVYGQHRGKHICVAGEELFVAETAPQAVALARQAHPEDDGLLLRYIPREKMERVYAHSRALDLL